MVGYTQRELDQAQAAGIDVDAALGYEMSIKKKPIVPDISMCEYEVKGTGCVRGIFCNHPEHPDGGFHSICSITKCPKFKKDMDYVQRLKEEQDFYFIEKLGIHNE